MNDPWPRERMPRQQLTEAFPIHVTPTGAAIEPALPAFLGSAEEAVEAGEIPGDAA
jgi:hypothetical protein